MDGIFLASLVVAVVAVAAPASAQDAEQQDDEARTQFEEGARAFSEGAYRVALERFTRAYELSGRPQLLFNMGITHDRLREEEAAIEDFEAYLSALPSAPNHAEVEARVAELRRSLAPPEESSSVFEQWWFWTIAGALVAGGVIAAVVLTHDPGVQDPLVGTTNTTSAALVSW